MSDPWASATRGFNVGIPLGVRAKEREEEERRRREDILREATRYGDVVGREERRRKEDIERSERHRTEDISRGERHRTEDIAREEKWKGKEYGLSSRGVGIAEAAGARQQEEFDIRQTERIMKKEVEVLRALVQAGNNFAAGKKIMDIYAAIPNGDDGIVIQREFDTTNAFEGVPEDINVAILSKRYGMITFKNMLEAVEHIARLTNATDIGDAMEANRIELKEKNAAETRKPFIGEDGKEYVRTWVMDIDGAIIPGPDVPYAGVQEMSKVRATLRKSLGREPTEAEVKQGLGIKEKEPTPGEKETVTLKGKRLEIKVKELTSALKAFTGKSEINIFASAAQDEPSGTVQSAVTKAYDLIDKAEKGKEKLTPTEKRLLPIARNIEALYQEMFGYTDQKKAGAKKAIPLGMRRGSGEPAKKPPLESFAR